MAAITQRRWSRLSARRPKDGDRYAWNKAAPAVEMFDFVYVLNSKINKWPKKYLNFLFIYFSYHFHRFTEERKWLSQVREQSQAAVFF